MFARESLSQREKPIIVANWKMFLPFSQAVEFARSNKAAFIDLSTQINLFICPPASTINSLSHIFSESGITLTAQNCSTNSLGAYTGQEAAQSFSQAGCTASLVGHSEVRSAYHETDVECAAQVKHLLEVGLLPILCIGETDKDHEQGQTLEIVKKQLMTVLKVLSPQTNPNFRLFIAYEPLWAIGTQKTPSLSEINRVMQAINETCLRYLKRESYKLLYGGSVDENLVKDFKELTLLDGFLIGSASVDFQKFEKIVVSLL